MGRIWTPPEKPAPPPLKPKAAPKLPYLPWHVESEHETRASVVNSLGHEVLVCKTMLGDSKWVDELLKLINGEESE
jgi:translation initiation factor 2 gamma subunit (eIF-2gamma)